MNTEELLNISFSFHGHKCPAMPLGFRAGIAAMRQLNVSRARDKELYVISETGKGHAAGCFLDGIMAATGCTYGKSNIEKLYYNKLAFTLIDVPNGRAVRVSLKPEFLAQMLKSPFLEERKKGIPPQDVKPEIVDPLVKKVLDIPEEAFLDIGEVVPYEFARKKGVFDAAPCERCHEVVFVDKLVVHDNYRICLGCLDEIESKS